MTVLATTQEDDAASLTSSLPLPSRSKLHSALYDFRGPLLVLLAEIFGSGMAASTRLLEMPRPDGSPGLQALQILFVRFSITAVLSLLYMWRMKVEHAPLGPPGVRRWLVLRGFLGFCGIFGFYYSLQYLPMAEAIIVTFVTPLMAAYFSSVFLGQPFSKKQFLAGLISLVGIIVVADPWDLSGKLPADGNMTPHDGSVFGTPVTAFQRFSAYLMGITSVFVAAGAYTVIRVIGTRAHTLISVSYYGFVATLVSGLILVLPAFPDTNFRLPDGLREWILLFGIGVFGFLLQYCTTVALVIDKSSKTTNMMYSQIVFALALDWAIWGTIPTATGWSGGAMVIMSVIWGSLQKEEMKKGAEDVEYTAVPTNDMDPGSLDISLGPGEQAPPRSSENAPRG